MSPIPNIKDVQKLEAAVAPVKIVICCECRKPLWELHNIEAKNYHLTRKVPIGDTPPWTEYWSKDGKTPLRVDCPHCREDYFQALRGPDGFTVPKLHILGIDNL